MSGLENTHTHYTAQEKVRVCSDSNFRDKGKTELRKHHAPASGQRHGEKTGPPGVQRETVFPAGSVFVARTQARVTGTARGHETTAARTSVDRAAQTDGDPRRGRAEICEPPS